jgi:hypothetical protein
MLESGRLTMDWLFWLSYALNWFLLVGIGGVVLALYYQVGKVYLSSAQAINRDGLAVGKEAPELSGISNFEEMKHLYGYRGNSLILVFGVYSLWTVSASYAFPLKIRKGA